MHYLKQKLFLVSLLIVFVCVAPYGQADSLDPTPTVPSGYRIVKGPGETRLLKPPSKVPCIPAPHHNYGANIVSGARWTNKALLLKTRNVRPSLWTKNELAKLSNYVIKPTRTWMTRSLFNAKCGRTYIVEYTIGLTNNGITRTAIKFKVTVMPDKE